MMKDIIMVLTWKVSSFDKILHVLLYKEPITENTYFPSLQHGYLIYSSFHKDLKYTSVNRTHETQ